jgi:hypothetical protein
VTTAPVPTLRPDIRGAPRPEVGGFWNFGELPTFVLNSVFVEETLRAVAADAFIHLFQRYSLNYAGAAARAASPFPFVRVLDPDLDES